MFDGYLAEIRGFAGNFYPLNWFYCAGQLLSIAQYTALYSLLGITYGGDGRTNFALPDLRGRLPLSSGQLPGGLYYSPGQTGGSEVSILTTLNMPVHTHTAVTAGGEATVAGNVTAVMKVNNNESEGKSPSGQFLGLSSDPDLYAESDSGATLNSGAISVDISQLSVQVSGISVQLSNEGESGYFSIVQPYQAINWIICVNGYYPVRS